MTVTAHDNANNTTNTFKSSPSSWHDLPQQLRLEPFTLPLTIFRKCLKTILLASGSTNLGLERLWISEWHYINVQLQLQKEKHKDRQTKTEIESCNTWVPNPSLVVSGLLFLHILQFSCFKILFAEPKSVFFLLKLCLLDKDNQDKWDNWIKSLRIFIRAFGSHR